MFRASDPKRSVDDQATRVVAHAESRPPRLGNSRLIVIDGPGGSGKSTLAEAIQAIRPVSSVVHLDDLYPGWTGLCEVPRLLPDLLAPMSAGHGGHYRRFDWHRQQITDTVYVPPRPLVVVEGCGAGLRALAPWISTLVWVEAPRPVRGRRGTQRGGVGVLENWRAWSLQEDALAVQERTRERADFTFLNR